MINPIGSNIKSANNAILFNFFILNEYELIYFAKTKDVANFANSAGCKLTGLDEATNVTL